MRHVRVMQLLSNPDASSTVPAVASAWYLCDSPFVFTSIISTFYRSLFGCLAVDLSHCQMCICVRLLPFLISSLLFPSLSPFTHPSRHSLIPLRIHSSLSPFTHPSPHSLIPLAIHSSLSAFTHPSRHSLIPLAIHSSLSPFTHPFRHTPVPLISIYFTLLKKDKHRTTHDRI